MAKGQVVYSSTGKGSIRQEWVFSSGYEEGVGAPHVAPLLRPYRTGIGAIRVCRGYLAASACNEAKLRGQGWLARTAAGNFANAALAAARLG